MRLHRLIRRPAFAFVLGIPLLGFSHGAAEPLHQQTFDQMLSSAYSSMGPIRVAGIALENFGVVDGRIYRGGQPENADYRALKTYGIKTVIDLRADFEKGARIGAESAGLKYISIPMVGQQTPTDAEAAAFIKALDDSSNGVVYVHCAGGRHRTGSMIAVYRIARDGWTVDQAYDEMLKFDFYTRFGHQGFKTYVFDYFKRMTADPASVPFAFVAHK